MLEFLKKPWILPVMTLVILGVLFQQQSVGQGQSEPNPWPSGEITYYNGTTDYAYPIARAIEVWNAADLGVHFVVASSLKQADVIFFEQPTISMCKRACNGVTTHMGYIPNLQTGVILGGDVPVFVRQRTVLHELGHVLGLEHVSSECSVMSPEANDACYTDFQTIPQPTCSLDEQSLKELQSLYGVEPLTQVKCPLLSYNQASWLVALNMYRHY